MTPERGGSLGVRRALLGVLLVLAALAAWRLGLTPGGFALQPGGRALLAELGLAALTPALDYEASVPAGTAPFAWKVAAALGRTLLYAAAAMSLAFPAGVALGVLASDVPWVHAGGGVRASVVGRSVQWSVRVVAALLRSVHELLWAVLLLAALGLAPASAVIAIAIPFAGTIAKVTAELIDEADREAWAALDALGASRLQALAVGLAPVAAPDVLGYGFYRFECALRSAAVLGFFGAPTIGTYVQQSFENLQFREMWTYLYALIALVVVVELVGSRLRRELA